MSKKIVKKRYWAFVMYPDSMPENWMEILQLNGLPVAVSPLHDKDIDPTGEKKKEHYHCILVYNGPTTFNAVKEFTEKLNGTIPISLESVRGYYRYLTHKDNPDKYQYQESEILKINGFDYDAYISTSEVLEIKKEIITIIRDNEITEYSDLIDFCQKEKTDWLEVVSQSTYFFNTYITSFRNKLKQGGKIK